MSYCTKTNLWNLNNSRANINLTFSLPDIDISRLPDALICITQIVKIKSKQESSVPRHTLFHMASFITIFEDLR